MEKVYLLLRNNKQTGPFTLQQLQYLGLKPGDLIWVEGESTHWHTIAEIQELNTSLQTPRKSEANRTQSPSSQIGGRPRSTAAGSPERAENEKNTLTPADYENNLERWAEAIRVRAEAYAATHPERSYKHPEHREIKPYRYFRDDNPIELVVHTKGNNTINGFQLLMVAAITIIIAGSWYGKFSIIPERKYPLHTSVAAAPSLFHVEPKKVIQQTALPTITADSATGMVATNAVAVQPAVSRPKAVNLTQSSTAIEELAAEVKVQPSETSTTKSLTATEKIEKEPVVSEAAEPTSKKQEPVTTQPEQTVTAEENDNKKKTFGQAIKGLFKKKKKDKEADPSAQTEAQ